MPSLILTDQTFARSTQSGADSYALILGTQEPSSLVTNCTIDGSGGEWGLKMPGNVGSTVRGSRLIGGKERALDIVRGSNLAFVDCAFSAGTDRPRTSSKWSLAKTCDIGIKGGARDITFVGCTMTDLLLGDHSIYDNPSVVGPRTGGIVLGHCANPNGGPIIIRAFNADLPRLEGTNAIALQWCGPVVKIYFWVAGKWIDSRMPSPDA